MSGAVAQSSVLENKTKGCQNFRGPQILIEPDQQNITVCRKHPNATVYPPSFVFPVHDHVSVRKQKHIREVVDYEDEKNLSPSHVQCLSAEAYNLRPERSKSHKRETSLPVPSSANNHERRPMVPAAKGNEAQPRHRAGNFTLKKQ